jgi:hypothetical protein
MDTDAKQLGYAYAWLYVQDHRVGYAHPGIDRAGYLCEPYIMYICNLIQGSKCSCGSGMDMNKYLHSLLLENRDGYYNIAA